ncbi:MAG TPA: hypothetical protein VFN88_11170 [Caulobacteraceae bacterium]|nr:hypothetical protein [Caulobacteraceae bacterium]
MAGWIRLGRVLEPAGGTLDRTHVMLPTPFVLADRVRVYFAGCDEEMRGRIFAAEFAPEPPFALLEVWREPVMDLGGPGAFDCDGVNPSQVFSVDGELHLFYIGWRRGEAAEPYTLFAGHAVSPDDGRTFVSKGQLLQPVEGERLFRTAPRLTACDDGFRLLYIGGDRFIDGPGGKRLPLYSLMGLRSSDPFSWRGPGEVLAAPDAAAGEIGFGRPVLFDARLMISVRTASGYELMEATEGEPSLKPVFQPPFEPWESQMRCFGAACRVGDHELLFYNGDGFGRTGLGLAYRPIPSS